MFCNPRTATIPAELSDGFGKATNKIDKAFFTKRPFTTQNMESEMAMDLCIDEKDEERESEAQSVVRAKKRARGVGGGVGGRALLRPHD